MLAWVRELDSERVLVLINTGSEPRSCSLEGMSAGAGEVVVATGRRSGSVDLAGLTLEPLEGVALRL